MEKEIFSAAAIILTIGAFIPYIRDILRNKIKPHVFSWIIWGSTTFIVFFAQIADDGGLGAWPIGVSGVISIGVAVLAFCKKGDSRITGTDWAFFTAAMASLPLWYFTSDPLSAVVILTIVDTLGFAPTFRKAYAFPHEEQLLFFNLIAVRNGLSLLALEAYTPATMLFQSVIIITCVIFVLMVLWRRRILAR